MENICYKRIGLALTLVIRAREALEALADEEQKARDQVGASCNCLLRASCNCGFCLKSILLGVKESIAALEEIEACQLLPLINMPFVNGECPKGNNDGGVKREH